MNTPDWKETFKEAEDYRKTAAGGMNRKAIFTPRILYNILALAAEKYCVALFYSRHYMGEGHSFQDLANSLQDVLNDKIDQDFLKDFRELDKPMMAECSLALYKPEPLDYSDIEIYLNTLDRLRILVTAQLPAGHPEALACTA